MNLEDIMYGDCNCGTMFRPSFGCVCSPGLDGDSVTNHDELIGKDAPNQHPISAITGLKEALDGKQDAEDGKGLSTNDYTNEEKEKLAGIEEGAQKNPDALPNPYKLVFSGAVEAEYDGSQEIHIEIPYGSTSDGESVTIDEVDPEKVIFSEDLTTTSAIGNIKLTNGQATIPAAGKNLVEVWNTIFVKEQNPTTTQPSISATFSESKAHEAGTEVTPTWSVSLNPGKYSYGPATGVVATKWEVSDTAGNTSESQSGSFPSVSVPDGGDYAITVKVTYGDGTIPVTNLGNEYAAGQIKGGTKTVISNKTSGYRNSFYGTMENKNEFTSDAIRSLYAAGSLENGASFDISIPVGAMRVVFACPSTLQGITSVKDVNGLGAEIASSFSIQTIQVAGANGYLPIDYKVYSLDFAKANDVENTYSVII